MLCLSKTQLSQKDYDKLIDAFAQQLWLLRERWIGIKALRDVNKRFFSAWTKHHRFFDSVYRSFVCDFYVGICRLVIDDTPNTSINREIEEIFTTLDKEQGAS